MTKMICQSKTASGMLRGFFQMFYILFCYGKLSVSWQWTVWHLLFHGLIYLRTGSDWKFSVFNSWL